MTWSVSWSWQSPARISAIESVNGHLCLAYGLELTLFNEVNEILWERWNISIEYQRNQNNDIMNSDNEHNILRDTTSTYLIANTSLVIISIYDRRNSYDRQHYIT